jgi:putative SOS response-associated peptidase YedK
MCGRAYLTYTQEELEARYITQKRKKKPLLGQPGLTGLRPNYNLSPTQFSPVVLKRDGGTAIEAMRFGLVPFWTKDLKDLVKYSLINAKAEEITEKRSYKKPFLNQRCIIPLSGFFEWKRSESGTKRPFAIHHKKEPILSVAGIWEQWQSKEDDKTIHSFAIITTSANSFMGKIHDRMPVILYPEDEENWLDPDNHDAASLKKLLKPCPSGWLEAQEVATRVNSPKNNSEDILKPVGK